MSRFSMHSNRTVTVAAAAVLVAAGVGACSNDDDDTESTTTVTATATAPNTATSAPGQSPAPTSPAAAGSDALAAAARKAIDKVHAKGATSIDSERGGHEVEVLLSDGRDQDVFVGADGTVTTSAPENNDDPGDPILDLDELSAISEAAVRAAGGGTMESIATDDDHRVAYEVTVRLADGRDADVDLAADLTVVNVDVDD